MPWNPRRVATWSWVYGLALPLKMGRNRSCHILHRDSEAFANLRGNNARHVLNDIHIPLDPDHRARARKVGASTKRCVESVVSPTQDEGVIGEKGVRVQRQKRLAFHRVPTTIIPLGGDEEPFLNKSPVVPIVEGGLVARKVLLDRGKQLVGHDSPFEVLIQLHRP